METQQIIQSIEVNLENYLDFLCDICAFEATATETKVINCMIDYIANFAQDHGLQTTRTVIPNCGDFLAVDLNSGAEKSCVFLAHTDTVHKKGSFGPQAVTRMDDRIVAPGVIDCKAGIAIALLVMQALKENGYRHHVRLLLTSDEEVDNVLGGQEEIKYIKENCAGFQWAINCETSEKDEVVVSRKGVLHYYIDIKGFGGHSGIHYFQCKNAIEEAAHKILALHGESQPGGITYSCNIIQGGAVLNVIPDSCRIAVDVRVPHLCDMEKVARVVEKISRTSYVGETTATLTLVSTRPPMEKTPETMALFEKMRNVCQAYGLGDLTPVESGGGSDSCYTQAAGVTSLCGMGGCGRFCHTTNEYLHIPSVGNRAKIIALFLKDNE